MKDQLNFRVLTKNRSTIEEENGKMIALQISPKIESLMDWVDSSQNLKGLYGILQLLRDSHLC